MARTSNPASLQAKVADAEVALLQAEGMPTAGAWRLNALTGKFAP